MPNANDINDIGSEAGVVASIILNPELVFHSEALTPHHFTNKANAYMYYAISQLAKRDIAQVDAYNIIHVLHANSSIRDMVDKVLTIPLINDFISNAPSIARMTVEEYKMVCDNVLNAAFRRDTYAKLVECEHLCFNDNVQDIEQKIYSALDDVMMEFSTNTSVPQYKDVVDNYWAEIQARQESGMAGIPFKFPALNDYAMIEPGELFIFAAEQKQGKSMMLLNCAVDLLRRGYSVMYIDSELSSRLFTMRLLAHLAKIEFNRVRAGCYNDEEKQRIEEAIAWLKEQKFTHLYMPIFDANSMYTAVKKVKHTQGVDILIIDYFKSTGDNDAFGTYAELGRLTDIAKNKLCGDLSIAGIGAAQATATGKIADSAKIGRNASTVALIQDKTPEEIQADGPLCGNKKLRIVLNRNGPQMSSDEYISLAFNGNLISYEQAAQQAIPQEPY